MPRSIPCPPSSPPAATSSSRTVGVHCFAYTQDLKPIASPSPDHRLFLPPDVELHHVDLRHLGLLWRPRAFSPTPVSPSVEATFPPSGCRCLDHRPCLPEPVPGTPTRERSHCAASLASYCIPAPTLACCYSSNYCSHARPNFRSPLAYYRRSRLRSPVCNTASAPAVYLIAVPAYSCTRPAR